MFTNVLIAVDIQEEYADHVPFDLFHFGRYLNRTNKKIILLYNGADTVGRFNEVEYMLWLQEFCGVTENTLMRVSFFDKGYGFFRSLMDRGEHSDTIVRLATKLLEAGVRDCRELTGTLVKDELGGGVEFEYPTDDYFGIPDVYDFLRRLLSRHSRVTICGGGRNECLREVELLLEVMGIAFSHNQKYVY